MKDKSCEVVDDILRMMEEARAKPLRQFQIGKQSWIDGSIYDKNPKYWQKKIDAWKNKQVAK